MEHKAFVTSLETGREGSRTRRKHVEGTQTRVSDCAYVSLNTDMPKLIFWSGWRPGGHEALNRSEKRKGGMAMASPVRL